MTESQKLYKFLVAAEIALFDSSITGRTHRIATGYSPNHNFGSPENREMRMGKIIVENDEWINPGQTREAQIQFIFSEGYLIDLQPGLIWRIQAFFHCGGLGLANRNLLLQRKDWQSIVLPTNKSENS